MEENLLFASVRSFSFCQLSVFDLSVSRNEEAYILKDA